MSNIDDIQLVEKSSGLDVSAYEGYRVKIESAVQTEIDDHWPDGETYSTVAVGKIPVIRIMTEPLKDLKTNEEIKFTKSDGSVTRLQPYKDFNLQIQNGAIVISKHPKAALWSFMRKMGVQKPSELVGKFVTLTTVPSKKLGDDRRFLRIVT